MLDPRGDQSGGAVRPSLERWTGDGGNSTAPLRNNLVLYG